MKQSASDADSIETRSPPATLSFEAALRNSRPLKSSVVNPYASTEQCDKIPATTHDRNYLLFCIWLFTTAAVAGVLCLGWQPGIWLQPTVVGLLWGGLFISGVVMGSVGRGRATTAALGIISLLVLDQAFQRLTSFGQADSICICTALLLSGWLAAKLYIPVSIPQWWLRKDFGDPWSSDSWNSDSPGDFPMLAKEQASEPESSESDREAPKSSATSNSKTHASKTHASRTLASKTQWTIFDIGFATTVIAIFASSLPHLEASPLLLYGVLAALAGGLMCSVNAYRWVIQDDWSLPQIVMLALGFVVAISLVYANSPNDMQWTSTFSWLLSGPINVMASQAVSVLIATALLRGQTLNAAS